MLINVNARLLMVQRQNSFDRVFAFERQDLSLLKERNK